MNILCLVSNNLGHLDFGGNGYLRLAQALGQRGHSVRWLSSGAVADRLEGLDEEVQNCEALTPIVIKQNGTLKQKVVAQEADHAVLVRQCVQSLQPDLCLIDRNLSTAALVVDSLGIPYASIGNPGGYWGRDENGVVSLDSPNPHYLELGQRLRERVPDLTSDLTSFWQLSPYLNIVFVGKSFYPMVADVSNTAFVNVFDQVPEYDSRQRLGIAFGNTGDVSVLTNLVNKMGEHNWFPTESIDLLVGGRAEMDGSLQIRNCSVHRWVDYQKYFPQYRGVVFFGGIGTFWHAVNHRVPMLVCPGGAGDQGVNAQRIVALGLGCSLNRSDTDAQALRGALRQTLESDFSAAFEQFHQPDNYTDGLESAVVKLEQLARV